MNHGRLDFVFEVDRVRWRNDGQIEGRHFMQIQ